MARPKGQPKLGGRQKGTLNKATAERIKAARQSGLLPHEFLLAISQGQKIGEYQPSFQERLDAAKAAAPYYAPRLAQIDSTVRSLSVQELSEDELDRRIAELDQRMKLN